MIKVSYSRVSSYLSCPQKHHFRYIQDIVTKTRNRPLSFGKDYHTLLQFKDPAILDDIEQAYYDLPAKDQELLGDDYLDDLKVIYSDYCEVWKDAEKPVETEHEFLIPIGKYKGEEILFHGFIDELYEDGTLGEHKTFNYKPDMALLAMNLQVCLYAKARYLETGKLPSAILWDYSRNVPASKPIWLKSGKFSEANNSNITHLSWLRACKERGIDDPKILEKAKNYEPNISNFFFRCRIEIVPTMVNVAWDSFKKLTKEIITKGGDNQIKNISRDCTWCDYKPICFAQFTGADVDYVIETDYIKGGRNG